MEYTLVMDWLIPYYKKCTFYPVVCLYPVQSQSIPQQVLIVKFNRDCTSHIEMEKINNRKETLNKKGNKVAEYRVPNIIPC